MSSSEYAVTVEDAMARLMVIEDYDNGSGPGPCVHTFRAGGPMLLGAHWGLDDLRAAMERYGVAEAGEQAAAMGHTLVVIDDHGPVFLQARPA